jgi:hypothetical protein
VEAVARVTARYGTVEGDYSSRLYAQNKDFEKALVDLYRSITVFYMKASVYFARSTLGRTWRGIVNTDDWTAARSAVDQAEDHCHKFLETLGLSTAVEKIDELLNRMCKMEHNDQLDRIEKWLLSDVDMDNEHTKMKDKLGSRYLKSGKWLLTSGKFEDWEKADQGQLWIQGAVGTGKTSLVTIIIDHIRPKKRPNFAFFYCSSTTLQPAQDSTSHFTKILRGLIGQLALAPDGRVAEELEICFQQAEKDGTLRKPKPLDSDQAKQLLIDIINSRHDTTIVIDGLDEFPKFNELLAMLQNINSNINSSSRNLKFLFSSQYIVPVDQYFKLVPTITTGSKDSIGDMEKFIEGQVEKFNESRPGVLKGHEELTRDIVTTLSKKAEGM